MEEKIVFKDKKSGEVYRAEWLRDDDPQNPRKDWDNLGTMVFADHRKYSLGDKQVSDFREFFIGQLNESEEEAKEYVAGTITFTLPTLEDCDACPDELSRFVAGTKETGYRFDAELFSQEMDGLLDGLKNSMALPPETVEDLSGGIPLDESQKLTGEYVIELKTPARERWEEAEEDFATIKEAIVEALSDFLGGYMDDVEIDDSFQHRNTFDDLSLAELYEKWAASKFCVVPIDIYEHSGITIRAVDVRKTLSATNDRDDGEIYNAGFVYVDKDNQEVLHELNSEPCDGYYIYCKFYDPSAHEMSWCIVGENGKETLSEELALLFDSEGKAKDWMKSEAAKEWQPCEFEVRKSIYKVKKTPEQVKEWAENILKGEIKTYAKYLEGDVHCLKTERFDRETMEWDDLDFLGSVYLESFEEALSDEGFTEREELSDEQVEKLETEITPEYKEAAWKRFVKDVSAALPEFDNDALHAAKAVLLSKKTARAELEESALKAKMAELGCADRETTERTLRKELGLPQSRSLPPLSFMDKKNDCFWVKVDDPNRSDNGGVRTALLLDWTNQRYAILDGCSQVLGAPSDTFLGRVEQVSLDHLKGFASQFVSGGWKNSPVEGVELEKCRLNDKRAQEEFGRNERRRRGSGAENGRSGR